jgi:hypothetical protein
VKIMTFLLLYSRTTAPKVVDAFLAAEKGDPSGLALMSLAWDYEVGAWSNFGDLFSKAVGADLDATRQYCIEMEPPGMPLGSPLSKLFWGPADHYVWPVKPLPEEYRRAHRSDVETLLMSGSIDVATPAEYAAHELLPYLQNGKQVVVSVAGHMDIQYLDTANTALLLTSFYNSGVPDESANAHVPMEFDVTWGFPTIAKLAIGGVVAVPMALLGAAVATITVFRRRRRRSSQGGVPGPRA